MQYGVCIETVFQDLPLPDRVRAVSEHGFDGIEFWYHNHDFKGSDLVPAERDLAGLAAAIEETGLVCTDFVWLSPDGAIDNASLINPSDFDRALERLEEVIPIADMLGCSTLIACSGNMREGVSLDAQITAIQSTLSAALPLLESHGLTVVIEPLNSMVDHPGYFLDSSAITAELIRELNHPSMKMLYDIYHMQIMEGNIISHIERFIDIIGHFHAAGVPGRHELFQGELNYREITSKIQELGYTGAFGLEYFPTLDSSESLKQIQERCLV